MTQVSEARAASKDGYLLAVFRKPIPEAELKRHFDNLPSGAIATFEKPDLADLRIVARTWNGHPLVIETVANPHGDIVSISCENTPIGHAIFDHVCLTNEAVRRNLLNYRSASAIDPAAGKSLVPPAAEAVETDSPAQTIGKPVRLIQTLEAIARTHDVTGARRTNVYVATSGAAEALRKLLEAAEIAYEVSKTNSLAGTDQNPMGYRDLLASAISGVKEWSNPLEIGNFHKAKGGPFPTRP